jgi:hypothetical protein
VVSRYKLAGPVYIACLVLSDARGVQSGSRHSTSNRNQWAVASNKGKLHLGIWTGPRSHPPQAPPSWTWCVRV